MREWKLNTSKSRIKGKIKWENWCKERKLMALKGKKRRAKKLWLANIQSLYNYWIRRYKLDYSSLSKD